MLRGSGDDVAITCLASVGPRKVAVGGNGGKLEIWDVEAVCAGGAGGASGGGGGEASTGLVRRLVSDGLCVRDDDEWSGWYGFRGRWYL